MLLKFLDGPHATWPFPKMSTSFLFYPCIWNFISRSLRIRVPYSPMANMFILKSLSISSLPVTGWKWKIKNTYPPHFFQKLDENLLIYLVWPNGKSGNWHLFLCYYRCFDKSLLECFWRSPLPTIWILSKSLILIGGHGNQKAKFSKNIQKSSQKPYSLHSCTFR